MIAVKTTAASDILPILLAPVLTCCSESSGNKVNLESIDLLRGEITLCGVQNFGEFSFALSCTPGVREKFDLALNAYEVDLSIHPNRFNGI